MELIPIPQWIVDARLAPKGVTLHTAGPSAPERIPKGRRNGELASRGGTMRRKGMSEESITAALLADRIA